MAPTDAATNDAAATAKKRSWADVARGVVKALSAEESPPEVESALNAVQVPGAASHATEAPAATDAPNGTSEEAKNQPWQSVADRVASAFATCAKDALRPAARGRRLCKCSGEVLMMFGHYGWIGTMDIVDHPDADMNGGRIYVHRRDVANDATLVDGDKVEFYLYVDEKGLGAEEVRLQGYAGAAHGVAPRIVAVADLADAKKAESLNLDPFAKEFVPILARPPKPATPMCPYAPSPTISTRSPESCAINEAYWSSSSESEEDFLDSASECGGLGGDHEVARQKTMDAFAFFSLRSTPLALTRKMPRKRRPRSNESTGTSSSDESDMKGNWALALPSGLEPPPGLGAPSAGLHPLIRPPPGLSLP
jgi:hypothetical protein